MGKGGGSGGGGNTAGPEAERLSGIQANIAQSLFAESSPIREALIGQTGVDLGTIPGLREGLLTPLEFSAIDPITVEDITANPAFAAQKSFTEQQFANARESALGNAPRGGTLQSLLGDIGIGRAQESTQQFGQLAQQEAARRERERAGQLGVDQANRSVVERDLDRILQQGNILGTGQAGQALSGLSAATNSLVGLGANQAAVAQSQASRDAGKSSGLGQAAGQIGSALIKNCASGLKNVLEEVNDAEIVEAFSNLDVTKWEYKDNGEIHIGPMAEDFKRLFGVGDGATINMIDAFGVLAAAVGAMARQRAG